MLAIVGMAIAPATIAKDGTSDIHWVGTWSASPQAASSPVELKGQTIRQIVRVSIGGKRVRVRLSNAFGADRLVIGAAHVALRSAGAAIAPGSDRILTFSGSTSTAIPPGALAVSDPVNLQVPDLGDLAVSIYVAGNQVAATEHLLGLQTTYISAEGDFGGADSLPTTSTTESVYFLTGVEVDAVKGSKAIVTLGDSITDGYQSTADANRRWPNRLAERLHAQKGGSKVAVLNAGIKGNRILHDKDRSNALARLDSDVLVQSGARYLIVLEGINDIGFPGAVTTEEIIAGHRQIIDRAHAMGLKVYGGTLTPFQNYLPGLYYTAVGEATAPGRQRMDQDQQSLRRGDRFRQGDPRPEQSGHDPSGVRQRRQPASERCRLQGDGRCHRPVVVRGPDFGAPYGHGEKPVGADGQAEARTLPVPAVTCRGCWPLGGNQY